MFSKGFFLPQCSLRIIKSGPICCKNVRMFLVLFQADRGFVTEHSGTHLGVSILPVESTLSLGWPPGRLGESGTSTARIGWESISLSVEYSLSAADLSMPLSSLSSSLIWLAFPSNWWIGSWSCSCFWSFVFKWTSSSSGQKPKICSRWGFENLQLQAGSSSAGWLGSLSPAFGLPTLHQIFYFSHVDAPLSCQGRPASKCLSD